jgi:hypothetical protein
MCEERNPPASVESPVVVRSHLLPEEYLFVVSLSDGFHLRQGIFRFFGLSACGPMPSIVDWNSSAWISEYGDALDHTVLFAEDVFGDQYGFQYMDAEQPPRLVKFWCEGGEVEPIKAENLEHWLLRSVVLDRPTVLDIDLAAAAALRGLKPHLDEHLAFSLPLILGGDYDVGNIEVSGNHFHLSLLGQVSVKNRSLPDGVRIRRFGDS